jgi:hypothetical protein
MTQEDHSRNREDTLANIDGESVLPIDIDNNTIRSVGIKGGCKNPIQIDEEDVMDHLSKQSKLSDMEQECQGWQSPKSRKSKKKKRKQVVVATRTSSRVPRDGIPIATKAMNRAAANKTGTASSKNPFTVLNNADATSLKEVILDLDIEVENVEEQIDIFKVEELARAAIAEANYKA